MSHPNPLVETYSIATCEHDGCNEVLGKYDKDFCDEHYAYYYCECGTRLEDAAGSPGDGLCRGCD